MFRAPGRWTASSSRRSAPTRRRTVDFAGARRWRARATGNLTSERVAFHGVVPVQSTEVEDQDFAILHAFDADHSLLRDRRPIALPQLLTVDAHLTAGDL